MSSKRASSSSRPTPGAERVVVDEEDRWTVAVGVEVAAEPGDLSGPETAGHAVDLVERVEHDEPMAQGLEHADLLLLDPRLDPDRAADGLAEARAVVVVAEGEVERDARLADRAEVAERKVA